MNNIELENLYFDKPFDDYIAYLASKNLLDYDDLKQDVFLEITEAKARTREECMKVARRVKERSKAAQIRESHTSLDEMIDNGFDMADDRNYGGVWYHDGSRLSHVDKVVSDLVTVFQPRITQDVVRRKLVLNGEL